MASRKVHLSLYLSAITVVMIRPTLAATCQQTGPCSCQMDDGSGTIDLSPLAGSGTPSFSGSATKWPDDNWQYSYNPCVAFDMQMCYGVAACQVKSDMSGESYDIGSQDGATFSMDGNNVAITYNAFDYQRHTIVKLVCSSSTSFTVDGEDPDAQTSFLLPHRLYLHRSGSPDQQVRTGERRERRLPSPGVLGQSSWVDKGRILVRVREYAVPQTGI
ncbi:uncharacterized protein LOC144928646 isoform X2 [Branchiostoma floridae x Branchiostoma belcheri]